MSMRLGSFGPRDPPLGGWESGHQVALEPNFAPVLELSAPFRFQSFQGFRGFRGFRVSEFREHWLPLLEKSRNVIDILGRRGGGVTKLSGEVKGERGIFREKETRNRGRGRKGEEGERKGEEGAEGVKGEEGKGMEEGGKGTGRGRGKGEGERERRGGG